MDSKSTLCVKSGTSKYCNFIFVMKVHFVGVFWAPNDESLVKIKESKMTYAEYTIIIFIHQNCSASLDNQTINHHTANPVISLEILFRFVIKNNL